MGNQNITKFPRYERYKDSGVIEIDQIPLSWKINRLGNILSSKTVKGGDDLPLLSITREKGVILRDLDNLDSNHNYIPDDLSNYKVIQMGEFGMNKMKAWQGSYGVSLHSGIVSPAYYIFEFRKYFDKSFFHYAIRSSFYIGLFYRASDGVRIGQWDLSQTRMKEIPFIYPSEIKEQTAIAQFIDHKTAQIDRAIAIKEEQIKLLNERKQIMIQEAVTKGLDPTVPMKDSGVEWIGEIPEHWRIVNFRYLIEFLTDYTANGSFADLAKYVKYLDKPDFSRLIRLTDLRKNLKNEGVYLSRSSHNFLSKSELFGGELLIANVGAYAGLAWLMPEIDYPATLAPNMLLIKTKNNISNSYLFYLLNSYCYSIYLTITAKSAAQPKLNKDDIRELQIVLPPLPEQEKIISFLAQEVNSEGNIVNKIKEQIQALKEYKTTLINEAVTGKIKVN